MHILLAENLAAQAQSGLGAQTSRAQNSPLGLGDLIRLAGDESDPARRALGVAAALVHLIDACFIGQRQNEPLALRDFKRSDAFDI
jgi:hypothetical protein